MDSKERKDKKRRRFTADDIMGMSKEEVNKELGNVLQKMAKDVQTSADTGDPAKMLEVASEIVTRLLASLIVSTGNMSIPEQYWETLRARVMKIVVHAIEDEIDKIVLGGKIV